MIIILKKFIEKIKSLDAKIIQIMDSGFLFSFLICIIALGTLLTYDFFYELPSLFYIGILLLRTGFIFSIMFIICAISFDTIQKELS